MGMLCHDDFGDSRIRTCIIATALVACALSPSQAGATLVRSPDGKTVYDSVTNVTWLADADLSATATFGLPLCNGSGTGIKTCVNASGSMNYTAAAAWVAAMNAAGYLGHTNWQLPTTPLIDSTCPKTGPNGGSFGFGCSASAYGSLYNALGLKAPNTAVPIPNNTVGPFSNFQPYLYWSQTSANENTGYASFSFVTGFQGANTAPNFLYALPMIRGKIPGAPPASGKGLQLNPGGQTVYDPVTNLTWLANANLAATNTFGLPLCANPTTPIICVSQSGAMSWDSANRLVGNMNAAGYLGQTHWELPPLDPNCPRYNCAGDSNPMGALFYDQLGLSAGTPVVATPDIAVSQFKNIQPYLYWTCQGATIQSACQASGPAANFGWSFSFGNGFQGTDLLANNLYGTAYFVGPRATLPTPLVASVQDAESARTTVVPGEWVAIYGNNLATPGTPCPGDAIRIWCAARDFPGGTAPGGPLPKSLDGTSVTFNGTPAAIYYVLPTQIAVQVPEVASGPASVVVSNNGTASVTFTTSITQSAPSFYINPVGGATYPAAVHNFQPITYVGDPAIAGPGYQKALPGEVIIMFVNGLTAATAGQVVSTGPDLSSDVTVTAGQTSLTVLYAALVAAGEFQLNVTIPSSLPAGVYPLTVSYKGQASLSGVSLPVGP